MTRPSRGVATIALSLAVAATLTGCGGWLDPGTAGSGREASEPRDVPAFDQIDVSGQTDVTVEPGEVSVTVRGDDNLLSDVRTEVNGGTLEVRERSSLRPRAGLVVEVTAPQLTGAALHGSGGMVARDVAGDTFSASVTGSGALDIDGITGQAFSARVSGSGGLRASGQVEQLDVSVSGSGDAQLEDLAARSATVDVTGSGDASVQVSETLDASSSGSGDVIYSGDPDNVREQASGSGEIRPR